MPQITSIEPQKKKQNRFNVYIDGEFTFGLDENIILKNNLKQGKNLTTKQIEEIVKENELGKLLDQSLRFLSYRPRSEKETLEYLAKKISRKEKVKFNQAMLSPLITQIITKLKKYKYLNDLDFAKWWVKSRTGSNPKGLYLIKMELIKKGISKDIIEKVFKNIKNETDLAKKAIEKKLKNWHKLSAFDFKKKAYLFLASKGFSTDTIREVVAYLVKRR